VRQLADKARKPIVLIDEADAWLDTLIAEVPLDARHAATHRPGSQHPTVRRTERCPGSAKKGNCLNCTLLRDHLFGRVDAHHQFEFVQPYTPEPPGDYARVDPPVLHEGDTVFTHVSRFTDLVSHPRYLDAFPFDRNRRKGETYDGTTILQDRIESAWRPRVVSHHPLLDGAPTTPEILRPLLEDKSNGARIQYPNAPCEVRMLVLPDIAPLRWLAQSAARVRFLTATLSDQQLAMLHAGVGQAVTCHRLEASERKIDELAVLVLYLRPLSIDLEEGCRGGRRIAGSVDCVHQTKVRGPTSFRQSSATGASALPWP
jgi:hypothetical protein